MKILDWYILKKYFVTFLFFLLALTVIAVIIDISERKRHALIEKELAEETQKLIQGDAEKFDLVIPRGGETLIDFVVKNSKVPVIISGRGNNFAYIAEDADFETAINIVLDGKSRLSVCNALDKVLIDRNLPNLEQNVARIISALLDKGIEVIGDGSIRQINDSVSLACREEIWFEEFLAAKIVIGTVSNIEKAIEKINKYSGGHSATIITKNVERAEQFMREVDCAAGDGGR